MSTTFAILYSIIGIIIVIGINRLYKNYREAQRLGLPIVIRLESFQDPLWLLLGPHIKPLLQCVGLYNDRLDMATIWWTFKDRNDIHAKLGPVFAHVTPFKLNVFISDVKASTEVMSQWRSWIKDETLYSIFTVFGQNVNTVNGRDWQRHRKLTSYGFKEANNRLVWQSTLQQTAGMKRAWGKMNVDQSSACITVKRLRSDMTKLALHVLAYAVFGKSFDFDHGVSEPEPGHQLSYAAALHTVLEFVGPGLAVTVWKLMNWSPWLLPQSIRDLQLAVREFKQYMVENIERERKELQTGNKPRDDHLNNNLLSSLVRANEAEKHVDTKDATKWFLSDDELYGNLFMFNTAGHETTAGILGYAIPLLAVHQDVQAWCWEEVDAVFGASLDVGYEKAFDQLVRIQALMYETLRWFSPLPIFPKSSGNEAKVLEVRGKQYIIPAQTFVTFNMNATHWDPEIWGEDVNKFKPNRWLEGPAIAGSEKFGGPPQGAEMLLWAFGPRICPGKKFSQVEFVAAIAGILFDRILKPVQDPGENMVLATKRLEEKILDSEHRLAMMPREPDRAAFLCIPTV